jgi:2-polyprenyl-3-methyl-5-hydroxy-6-metoxy-1,4-benzoquinol methylase
LPAIAARHAYRQPQRDCASSRRCLRIAVISDSPTGREIRRVIAGVYGRAASTYDQFASSYFAHFGKQLAEAVPVRNGMSVLDIACGTGAFALAAADRGAGSILACDLAEGIAAATRGAAIRRGLPRVRVAVMERAPGGS